MRKSWLNKQALGIYLPIVVPTGDAMEAEVEASAKENNTEGENGRENVVSSSRGAMNSARMEFITLIFLERHQPLHHEIKLSHLLTPKEIPTEAKCNPNEAMHCLETCQPLHPRQAKSTHPQLTRLYWAEEPWLLPKINTRQGVLVDWK